MRGKVNVSAAAGNALGITPAYAGKSLFVSTLCRCVRDHPRVCGEKLHMLLCVNRRYGSPPRMRGKAELGPGAGPLPGITPAYAGKSPEGGFA